MSRSRGQIGMPGYGVNILSGEAQRLPQPVADLAHHPQRFAAMPVLFPREAEDQIHGHPNARASALAGGFVHVRDMLVILVHLPQDFRRGRLRAEADVTDAARAERFHLFVGHAAEQVGRSLERPVKPDARLQDASRIGQRARNVDKKIGIDQGDFGQAMALHEFREFLYYLRGAGTD